MQKIELMLQSDEFKRMRERVESDAGFLRNNPSFAARRGLVPDLGLFMPLMDLSKCSQNYHRKTAENLLISLGLCPRPREVYLIDGWLFYVFGQKDSNDDLPDVVFNNPGLIRKIVVIENESRKKCFDALKSINTKDSTETEIADLFKLVTNYGAMSLDSIAKRQRLQNLLEKKVESDFERIKIINSFLYPSEEIPTAYIISNQLLKLAYETGNGGSFDNHFEEFIDVAGYLERTDLKPCRLEDKEYIANLVYGRIKAYGSIEQILQEREELFRSRMVSRATQREIYGKICSYYKGPKEQRLICDTLSFFNVANNYDESNKKIRTRFFKILERWFHSRGLDPLASELSLSKGL